MDELLADARFFAPFRLRLCFDSRYGRPSLPIETYLRMMVLKYRYRLGFESLCREVADSIAWRRFCRIPLDCLVPHPSTLEKITVRAGERTIEELNEDVAEELRRLAPEHRRPNRIPLRRPRSVPPRGRPSWARTVLSRVAALRAPLFAAEAADLCRRANDRISTDQLTARARLLLGACGRASTPRFRCSLPTQ